MTLSPERISLKHRRYDAEDVFFCPDSRLRFPQEIFPHFKCEKSCKRLERHLQAGGSPEDAQLASKHVCDCSVTTTLEHSVYKVHSNPVNFLICIFFFMIYDSFVFLKLRSISTTTNFFLFKKTLCVGRCNASTCMFFVFVHLFCFVFQSHIHIEDFIFRDVRVPTGLEIFSEDVNLHRGFPL